MRRDLVLLLAGLAAVSGCREADRPAGPVFGGRVAVDSDPQGAVIYVDTTRRAETTPDTLDDVPVGTRIIGAWRDSAGVQYGFAMRVEVPREGLVEVSGPLLARCFDTGCYADIVQQYTVNSMRFATTPTGRLFYVDGSDGGLYWPSTTNSYLATGTPIFAGVSSATSREVATGAYAYQIDETIYEYLAGRPAPQVEQTAEQFSLTQTSWVLPPGTLVMASTVRGLEITQQVIGRADPDGVLLVRLTFRNITNDPLYRRMDPVPEGGVTYTDAYIGFALDPDIGGAEDDLVSYDPSLGLAFAYDSDFKEPGFTAGWADRPGLVGLRLLEAPPGTSPLLTAWPRPADWYSGVIGPVDEEDGWWWLAGRQHEISGAYPDHPDGRIGFAPTSANDYRIAVSAGPLTLAPGDSARLTVAVVIAEPRAGTFTPGQPMSPGDPLDTSRAIYRVAEALRQRAIAAADLVGASLPR